MYYQDESNLIIQDDLLSILRNTTNTSSINMWKEFSERLPQLNKTELPKDLTSIWSIPPESLIDKLRSARRIKASKNATWPNYYYLIIGFVMPLISGILIYVICRIKTCKSIGLPTARFASIRRWGRGTSKRRQVVASPDGMESNDIPLKLMPSAPRTTANDQAEYKLLYSSLSQNSEDMNNTAV